MNYKYIPPEEYGFKHFKLTRKEHNEALFHRKKKIFTKIDAYYSDKEIKIHYTTNVFGKIIITLLLPVTLIMNGLSSIKEIKKEYADLWNEKETGSFTSEHIRAVKFNGDSSKYFSSLQTVYEGQERE